MEGKEDINDDKMEVSIGHRLKPNRSPKIEAILKFITKFISHNQQNITEYFTHSNSVYRDQFCISNRAVVHATFIRMDNLSLVVHNGTEGNN